MIAVPDAPVLIPRMIGPINETIHRLVIHGQNSNKSPDLIWHILLCDFWELQKFRRRHAQGIASVATEIFIEFDIHGSCMETLHVDAFSRQQTGCCCEILACLASTSTHRHSPFENANFHFASLMMISLSYWKFASKK